MPRTMIRIKICGITNADDARAAAEAGADAIGLIFADSPRRVTPAQAARIVAAVPVFVTTVGVFVDADAETIERTARQVRLDRVQLHGDEPPELAARLSRPVIKRLRVGPDTDADTLRREADRWRGCAILLDPGAGSGEAFDWSLAAELGRPVIVAGGLTVENVAEAIRQARPAAVDVCSGVEREPGRKSVAKMQAFVRAVRDQERRAK